MRIETRYNIGDVVYARLLSSEVQTEVCPVCNGSHRVQVAGSTKLATCPECNHHGTVETGLRHYVAHIQELTVGQVRVVAQQRTGGDNRTPGTGYEPDEITYMAWETGVGTGRVWKEDELHASRKVIERLPIPPDEPLTLPVKPYDWRGEDEPDIPDFDPGPEVDDEGGMSEHRSMLPAMDEP